MKYNITLNQPLMIENKLNVSQWCILDVISVAPIWCEAVQKDNEVYYWVARQKISGELKALDLKSDTIYRYIKQLVELGFINHIKDGKKDLIKLTQKGKSLFVSMSEKNPNYYVGKKSELNSEKNPTYKNTNSNKNTNIKNIKNKQKEKTEDEDLPENINLEAFNQWCQYKGKNYSRQGKTLSANKLAKFTHKEQREMVDNSIMNNYKGLFEVKNKSYGTAKAPEVGSIAWRMHQQNNSQDTIDAEVEECIK